MTIDVQRALDMPDRRCPCDDVASDIERFYRVRPDIRHNVTLSIELVRPRSVGVVYIRTLNKGRGHAGSVMDAITRSADAHGVILDLDARAIRETEPGESGLPQYALVDFYRRRGFRVVSRGNGSASMRRLASAYGRPA